MNHTPVLLHESVDGLDIHAGDVVVDATLGAGGHSSEIARALRAQIHQYGFDLDNGAIAIAKSGLKEAGGAITVINANFRHMDVELAKIGIDRADRVLFDLGVSSMEFGKSGRGFTFTHDEPLYMTLSDDPENAPLTAGEIVNSYPEDELANVIYEYGEERLSRQIAKGICIARRKERIETTGQLSEIIKASVPGFYRNGRIHPATRTFQALRIATNDELGALADGIAAAWKILAPGGRIAIITFHSLEDRIVKNLFKEYSKEAGTLIVKKPLVPSRDEIRRNLRSRSAKLRIIEKKK